MRLIPSDPDVATIINRILPKADGSLPDVNLQPEFQRGEVWGKPKKRRLIDTILRNWHVPPIHLIEVKETGALEVLDGQQRLVAIRDFVNGDICVDGKTDPYDANIAKLNDLHYRELPLEWRRRFDQFSIRVFKIVDYEPGEPGELFFRLNSPTHLTASEQRNAFFGPARQQVKDVVLQFPKWGLDEQWLGFSNSRMAFEDVVARVCCSLQLDTLSEKLTANAITERYRSQHPFSPSVIKEVMESAEFFGHCRAQVAAPVRFNKTTLYSWLCFIASVNRRVSPSPQNFCDLITHFEVGRAKEKPSPKRIQQVEVMSPYRGIASGVESRLFQLYNDRATSRVADTSSVLIRHVIHWICFCDWESAFPVSASCTGDPCMNVVMRARDVLRNSEEAPAEMLITEAAMASCWKRAL